jgi:rare lipoprotein A
LVRFFLVYLCMEKIIIRNFTKLLALFLVVFLNIGAAPKLGKATYYNHKMEGRHTSDGGKYRRDSLTCAHLTYPFGTILKVRNPKNDKVVIVKVTDRGPHSRKLMIDLSYRAAQELDIVRAGIAQVEITKLDSMPVNNFQDSILMNNDLVKLELTK